MNPMTRGRRRFVDLSIYLENDVLSDPPPLAPKITYQKHADTLPEFMAMIPGTKPEDYGVFSFMKNGGCSVSPLGTFDGKVPAEVVAKVAEKEKAIKDGSFTVEINDNEPKG